MSGSGKLVVAAMTYDDDHLKTDSLFGTKPESILTRFFDRMGQKFLVLNVGAGHDGLVDRLHNPGSKVSVLQKVLERSVTA